MGEDGVGGVVVKMGATGGTVRMANVLDFLLTAAQLHRVRSGGRILRGSGGHESQSGGGRGNNSTSTTTTTTTTTTSSSSSTTVLPSASTTWTRLLDNPASSTQDGTLALLQLALQDGLLDSILPYMVSSSTWAAPRLSRPTPPTSKAATTTTTSTLGSKGGATLSPTPTPTITTTAQGRRLSPTPSNNTLTVPIVIEDPCQPPVVPSVPSLPYKGVPDRSPAIVIHVCDEARGLRQDFTCPRDLLIHHIGYFADVTAGQRLEDVDISVHCDVTIFEWLLQWVKQGQTEDHVPPVLDVAPGGEVLQYVHDNINLILEAQVNLNCLSDSVLARLARLFTHWELESVRDRRDRIQNKLYTRFIIALCDSMPVPPRGIYKTAASLYRCCDCGQLVSRSVERLITCVPANTTITTTGYVYYTHTRDGNWSLTDHVKQLKVDLKTWRLVYWRLWGQVHFLPCSTCGTVFPGSEMKLCRTHPLDASACDMDTFLASNTHTCCGARALRFSPLPVRNGCQVTEHTVQLSHGGDLDTWGPVHLIYDDLLTFQVLICIDPPTYINPVDKVVLWAGVALVPCNKSDRSLLDRSWLNHHQHHGERDVGGGARVGAGEGGTATTGNTVGGGAAGAVSVAVSSESSSDEEEGGSRPRISSRLRNTLLRRATHVRRALACE
ncbi:hypothetical protein Pmani_030797 [Petrolisthes manimaculis]|uniref:SANT and BTB domain-containing protein n=1 Tax=Petrolisthes manimaculis TaxID=1843537 RepID=A0AAE1TVI8_9EUCA|nr:hypothetical protein Pmani_030797 [Petrolisthes manimaculis]